MPPLRCASRSLVSMLYTSTSPIFRASAI
jgi:hypothetical protein